MKKVLVLGFVIFLLFSTGVYAELHIDGFIPDEDVRPGETFTLYLNIENVGGSGASDVQYEIIADSAIGGYTTGKRLLGGIPAYDERSIEIPLFVSKDATTGKHSMTLRVWYDGGSPSPIVHTFDVYVGSEVDLYLEEMRMNELLPGENTMLRILIRNVGADTARKVTGKLVSTEDIYPIGVGGESFVESIGVGRNEILSFAIGADRKTETGIHNINVVVFYMDSTGAESSETFEIGIEVSGKPMLEVLNTEVDGREFKVEVGNLGNARAKAIRAELIQNNQIIDIDIDNELKADKHTTFRFENFMRSDGSVVLTFLDDNNQEYRKEVSVSLGFKKNGRSGMITIFTVINIMLLSVAVCFGVYIYNDYLEKKNIKRSKN